MKKVLQSRRVNLTMRISLFVWVLITICGKSYAQDESPWSYDISAALWTGNTGVEVLPRDATDPVKIELPDFLDNFQLGLVLRGEARWNKLGAVLDVGYIQVTASDEPSRPDIEKISVEVNSTLVNFSGIFRLHGGERFVLDVMPGIQYYNGDSDIAIRGDMSGITTGNESFWDPVLGLRARTRLWDKLGINLYGNVGGFGASSQTTSQVAIAVGYNLLEALSARVGYRLISWDFDETPDQRLLSQRISGVTIGFMLSL